jgi:hypothetical protein
MSETKGKNEGSRPGEGNAASACACGPFCFEVTPGAKGVTIRIEVTDPARAEALKALVCCAPDGCAPVTKPGCCDGRGADRPGAGERAPASGA